MTRRSKIIVLVSFIAVGILGVAAVWMLSAYRKATLDADLILAVKRSDVRAVDHLLSRGADANALERKRPQSVREVLLGLLQTRKNENNSPSALQIAVDHHVVSYTNIDVVRLLINHGADVNRKDRYGNPPLVAMFSPIVDGYAESGFNAYPDPKCELLLVEAGCDVNAANKDGLTALIFARDAPLIRRLLEKGAKNTMVDGSTALDYAVWDGDTEKVKLLLDFGAEADHARNDGWTPLHTAAQKGLMQIASLLVSHGADVNHQAKHGRTPLISAAMSGNYRILQYLLEHGADPNVKGEFDSTALASAARGGNTKCVEVLLANHADVNARDNYGWTPLHLAAMNGHLEAAKLLLSHKAEVNAKAKNGWTPLFEAAACGYEVQSRNLEIAKLLLANHADVNAKGMDGETPLHLAAVHGNTDIVKLLLAHKAEADAKDK